MNRHMRRDPTVLLVLLAACDTPSARETVPGTEVVADTSMTAQPFVIEECDRVHERVGTVLRIPVERIDGGYHGYWRDAEEHGCQIRGAGRFSALGGDLGPVGLLLQDLQEQGWEPSLDYSADGPDGSVAGVSRSGVLCMVIGSWDGGDDATPPDTVPAPSDQLPDTYEIRIECIAAE
jgi:hypothetical protein